MPTLKLVAGKPASTPRAKPAGRSKPAAKKPPTRTAPARRGAAKPAAPAPADNGSQTRGPKLPEGWTNRDWDALVKQMDRARQDKAAAQESLTDAQTAVNELAMDAIDQGVQMSVVSEELSLSRQRLYDLMDLYGVQTERQATNPHPNKGLTQDQIDARVAREARAKPAARKPAAKRTAARKAPAKKAPARKAPAKKTPARKAPARKPAASKSARGTTGRVRLRAA